MEKFSKETLEVMSKDELKEAVETLQLKLETSLKEIEELKALAEVGKKYYEHLKAEAKRLINLVHKESPVLKLIDTADADTLSQIIEEFSRKAKELYKPSSISDNEPEPEVLTKEKLQKMNYQELMNLSMTLKEIRG
jgi:hypothetical protein